MGGFYNKGYRGCDGVVELNGFAGPGGRGLELDFSLFSQVEVTAGSFSGAGAGGAFSGPASEIKTRFDGCHNH